VWFYIADGTQHGPVAFEPLVASLLRAADPRAIHLWRDGMPDWQLAGSVPEVAARLTPPPVPRPAAPARAPDAAVAPDGETPVATVLAVARYYRRLILLVAAEIVVCWLMKEPVLNGTSSIQTIALILMLLVVLGFAIPMAVTVYPLMSELDEGVPALWSIAMFLPIVNLVTLLVISSKSQAWCRKRRIYVGLFGPAQESIDWIRRG
jgi:hypothetical protein